MAHLLEPDPQGAGRGAHRPAGIWALGSGMIAAERGPRGAAIAPSDPGRYYQQQPAQSSGEDVEQVVEPGCCFAELLVVAMVADHRVECIGGSVHYGARQAEQ